jgi:hypothetical protein
LSKETEEIEKQVFGDFCQKLKIGSVREYEETLGKSGDLVSEKANFEKEITQGTKDLQFLNK